jgi:large-conductance mechanosensitive channel
LILIVLVFITGAVSLALGVLIGGAFGIALVGIVLGIFLVPIDGLVRSVLYFTLVAKSAESLAGGQVEPSESGSGPIAFG